MKNRAIRISFAAGSLLGAALTAQAEYRWVCLTANEFEKAIDTAKNYSDTTMWTEGVPANEAGALAYFRPKADDAKNWGGGVRYTILNLPITVGKIVRNFDNTRSQDTFDANRRWLIAGDNEITLESTGELSLIGLGICGPVRTSTGTALKLGAVDLCGPLSNDAGLGMTIVQGQSTTSEVRFRRDRWATDTSSVISNVAPQSVKFDMSNVLSITCPRGNEALNGVWTTVEGDSRLRYVSGPSADELSVGSVVTGEGVPEGAFVKYIYPDGTIALSAPATASSSEDGVELAFGAFAPVMYQNIASVDEVDHTATSYTYTFKFGKSRAEDEFTVDIGKLFTTYGYRLRYLVFDVDAGLVPARVRVHNASAFNSAVQLGTCDLEFPGTNAAVTAGVVHSTAFVTMGSAAAVAKVSVPDGVTAHFNSVTNFIGTFEKQGEGTLVFDKVRGLAADETGVIRIDAGELAFTAAEGADAAATVSALEIAAGAKLTLDGFTLTAKAAAFGRGARIEGAGRLYVPMETDLTDVAVGGGVRLVRIVTDEAHLFPSDGVLMWNVPDPADPLTLTVQPAVWLDVSKQDSLTFADAAKDGAGYRAVSAIGDRRGESFGETSLAVARYPVRGYTNEAGKVVYIYIPYAYSSENFNALKFSCGKVSGIHSVFKVMNTHVHESKYGSCPQPLGWSNLKTSSTVYTSPALSGVTSAISNTVMHVNGDVRDWRDGYPYGSAISTVTPALREKINVMVVEFEVPDGSGYGSGLGYQGKGLSGRESFYECLIYTNRLTETERAQITGYLMKKWMNADLPGVYSADDKAYASLDMLADAALDVPDGSAIRAQSMPVGSVLEKDGGGTLYLDDLTDGSASVDVRAGKMTVRSLSVTRETLPGNPYFHVDASDADTLTLSESDVREWRDVRGEGHPVATNVISGTMAYPALESEALGGLSAVNFGGQSKTTIADGAPSAKSKGLLFAQAPIRSFVEVIGTQNYGGVPLGWYSPTVPAVSNGQLYGLYRDPYATSLTPIVSTSLAAYPVGESPEPGAARVRLNFEDVSPTETNFTSGWDVMSVVNYQDMTANGLGITMYDNRVYSGGQKFAESIMYTNAISREATRQIESYLNKKWFGVTTPGYRPAVMGPLSVEAGAELEIVGGAPLTVTGLKGAGTVDGAVAFAADAVFTVAVGEDGTLSVPTVSGGLDVSAGGTVLLVGAVAALEPGTYDLGAVKAAETYGTWTAVTETPIRKVLSVGVSDGHLVLTVTPRGTVLLIR